MEVKCTVSLGGLEEALNQVGPKLAKSHLRKALKAGMKVLQEDAKSRAPVDTGALRDSIKTLVVLNANKESGRATVGPTQDPGLKKDGQSYSESPALYGMFVEFGVPSRHIERQPFMRPAFDAQADAVVQKFADTLRDGLEEAAT